MKIFAWLLRTLAFVVLFGLAIKNSASVDVRLYLDAVWQAPLSLVILSSFATGVLIGLTALSATLIRQRREIGRLEARIHKQPAGNTSTSSSSEAKGVA